ncbi:NAD-dependent epimerase/dehydratase family protein [Parvularcula marina]|uniref:NAD(P)-dependent oxidoreductase n=1 Tax=Parvularcula marina TaxID=2292771 RepID=A0A371R896_9PROT|nr:NAD(P)-dependent oxidoreductase [Parvularcula marina]RFB01687.1 NAD(P)-dependent oxidoreductase [Parvularcula marina]
MRYLVTGSSGHLGEALMRSLRGNGAEAVSIDIKPGPFTDHVGSITDPGLVRELMRGINAVLHTATLHKPHVATHSRQDFIDTNVTGTNNLLEAAISEGVGAFVFTSTTSAFGAALTPPPGAPAAWITEEVRPVTKNIYGATKLAAEDLCWLAHKKDGLDCLILRTSRFFPEEQDDPAARALFSTPNAQANEFLHRRVDIEDVVSAHLLAAEKAPQIGFGRYIISAPTPFSPQDTSELRENAPAVIGRYADYRPVYDALGWTAPAGIDRVYDSSLAQKELGWTPKHDFAAVLARVAKGGSPLSQLAAEVGVKGYHEETFEDGPYPVE